MVNNVYVITSGKGGVGKTTITATLGCMVASLGYRVLVVDMDFGLNNLDLALGLEDCVTYDISDVVSNRCGINQALVEHSDIKNLYFLASKNATTIGQIKPSHIESIIYDLSHEFDYIFIDSPAGVGAGLYRSIVAAHNVIVVVTPHISSIRDAKKLLSLIDRTSLSGKYLVVNKVKGNLILDGNMIDVDMINKYIDLELIGVVPDDDYISAVTEVGDIGLKIESIKAIEMIANIITKNDYKIYDCKRYYRGPIGYLRRVIKRWVS